MITTRRIIAAALLSRKAKKLLAAAVLCWVVGIIIILVVLSASMPIGVAGPIITGASGLIVFGVLLLIFAFVAFLRNRARSRWSVSRI